MGWERRRVVPVPQEAGATASLLLSRYFFEGALENNWPKGSGYLREPSAKV